MSRITRRLGERADYIDDVARALQANGFNVERHRRDVRATHGQLKARIVGNAVHLYPVAYGAYDIVVESLTKFMSAARHAVPETTILLALRDEVRIGTVDYQLPVGSGILRVYDRASGRTIADYDAAIGDEIVVQGVIMRVQPGGVLGSSNRYIRIGRDDRTIRADISRMFD